MQQIERDCFSVAKHRSIYIYDVSISGFTRSSIYIYEISSLRVNYLPRRHVSNHEYKRMDYKQFVGTFVMYLVTKCYVPGLIGTSVTAARWKANTNIYIVCLFFGTTAPQ